MSNERRQPHPIEDRYAFGILQTCEQLHNSLTGVNDPLPDTSALELYDWLKMRAETWKPTQPTPIFRFNDITFDTSVLCLVCATIGLCQRFLENCAEPAKPAEPWKENESC